MEDAIKSLGELWGAPGIIIGLMVLAVGYLYRGREADRKQYVVDLEAIHKEHKIEIAQWTKLVLEIQEKRITENQTGDSKLIDAMNFANAIVRAKGGDT